MLRQLINLAVKGMTTSPKIVPIPKNGVDYRNKVVLAPMVRSGELPSRLLALHYGADLVWGPETVDKAMIGTTRKANPETSTIDFTRYPSNSGRAAKADRKESIIYRIHPAKEGKRLIFQLGTASPATAVEAAQLVARDVAGIDVNAGCPKPFSTLGGMGAALLQDPERLASILRALVERVGAPHGIGISVKIRLLETAERTAALVRTLVGTGIAGLTVHCRTTPMRPREQAIRDQLRMIGELCRAAGVACLMNGDVRDRDEARALAAEYGVDGAMIARAAEANPSVFRSKAEGGALHWREVALEYARTALEVENRWGNTKFLLAQIVPGKAEEGKKCQVAKSYVQMVEALGLGELYDRARDVDEKLGLTDRTANAVQKAMKGNSSAKAAGRRAPAPERKEEESRNMLSQRGVAALPAMAV